MLKKILPCLALFFICFSCSKKYTTNNLPLKSVQFGTGGGFTGKKTNYMLLENGQLFLQKDLEGKTFEEVGKLKSKEALAFFKQFEQFQAVAINRPGNFNHFVMIKNERGEAQYWQWANDLKTKDSTVNKLFLLHKNLLQTVPGTKNTADEKEKPQDIEH
jgi:hypothetical protein